MHLEALQGDIPLVREAKTDNVEHSERWSKRVRARAELVDRRTQRERRRAAKAQAAGATVSLSDRALSSVDKATAHQKRRRSDCVRLFASTAARVSFEARAGMGLRGLLSSGVVQRGSIWAGPRELELSPRQQSRPSGPSPSPLGQPCEWLSARRRRHSRRPRRTRMASERRYPRRCVPLCSLLVPSVGGLGLDASSARSLILHLLDSLGRSACSAFSAGDRTWSALRVRLRSSRSYVRAAGTDPLRNLSKGARVSDAFAAASRTYARPSPTRSL